VLWGCAGSGTAGPGPVTSEVAHIGPPRTWGVRGIDGPIRAAVDVTVEPVTDARSRLTIDFDFDFDGQGIGKVLVPLVVRREARTEMPANLAASSTDWRADSPSPRDLGSGKQRNDNGRPVMRPGGRCVRGCRPDAASRRVPARGGEG
jgi:hypothetical protein